MCEHEWQPLINLNTEGVPRESLAGIAFALAMQRIDKYERCAKCDRIGWLSNSYARHRRLVRRADDAQAIRDRAARFEQWANEELAK